MSDPRALLEPIRQLHAEIRDRVLTATLENAAEAMASVAAERPEDTIYSIDRVSEGALVELCARTLAPVAPIVLIAEGLEGGARVLPEGESEERATLRVIVDPIDGTRGLMYQKRSAWILTGVAPNRGARTTLADIEVAVQTEIPLVKQHLSDCLWATRAGGVGGERFDRLSGRSTPLVARPSRAHDLRHGFAQISRFFPGGRDLLAAVDEQLMSELLGPSHGRALAFEDQYISSGGQLYELMMGHDRFVADLRPLLAPLLRARGEHPPIACHPYDLCTELIARELGVVVTDARGGRLDAPLDLTTPLSWVAYANSTLRAGIEPVLQRILREQGLQ